MPFISTKTNVTVSMEKETQLKERPGQVISDAPEYGSLKDALIGMYGEEVRVKDRRAIHFS
ncbi:MAG: hypothetical protein K6E91_14485 [Butyrivibrio sp.]|nr:hypothetical protein [Butyrivibrio sp.]